MEKYQETPGRKRELEHCANPTCGHRRLHHHPRAGVCMVSAHQIDSTGWCPCDEFETPVDLATPPEVPSCTYAVGSNYGHVLECGAPLIDRQQECVKCKSGHWMARPDLFEPSEPDDEGRSPIAALIRAAYGPEPEDALDTAFAMTEKTRRGWLESVTFPTEAPHQGWAGPGNSAIFESPSDESLARAHAVADGMVSLTAAHRALDQAADRERRNDLARARRASVLHPEANAAAAEKVTVTVPGGHTFDIASPAAVIDPGHAYLPDGRIECHLRSVLNVLCAQCMHWLTDHAVPESFTHAAADVRRFGECQAAGCHCGGYLITEKGLI